MYNYVKAGEVVTASTLNSLGLIGQVVFTATRDAVQVMADTGSGNPSVASNAISWESVGVDDLGGWSSGSATRYTCQLDGWYKVDSKISYAGSSGVGNRSMGIYVNGSLQPGGHFRTSATFNTGVTTIDGYLPVLLAAGDYVQIAGGQDTGGNLDTGTGGARPSISLVYERPAD